MYKVLLTDHMCKESVAVFAAYPEIEIVCEGTLGGAELAKRLPDFDAVIIRSPTKLTREIIAAAHKLKFIGRAGVGVDNIDVEAAEERGICVLYVPAGNTISTAEHSVGMILAAARRIPEADRSMRAGRWDRGALDGMELHGKTLGIIGLGRVGREVARRMLGFSMRIVATDPNVLDEEGARHGVTMVELDTLLRESHVISIHVALTRETEGLISDDEIAAMRNGALLVNCSRGEVVDDAALTRGLQSGKLAAVALDVFAEEPPGDLRLFE
ncbi:MAG: D-3-phosphoglycerate dehydrogenase, partial [Candidatus Krumholzibacteriota bacterium]|nr:D-3-phosphoglycerate dehydrogenase [Candidatus Krumholzibacteriota bacterium]